MDGDNSLNLRHWGYYEQPAPLRGLNLQLMPEKPLLDTRTAAAMAAAATAGGVAEPFNYHHRDFRTPISQSMFQMEYNMRADPFHNPRMFSESFNYSMFPETSTTQHMQMIPLPPPVLTKDESVDQLEEENVPSKKRPGPKCPKSPKPKKPKKGPPAPKPENGTSVPRARAVKKSTEVMINGINMDISSIPIPVCSCTGSPQQCYRWGSGGWQSACCTTGLSIYPLPMSTKRRGARIAGRKMSLGAFKKVLEKLAAEGYNFSNPIDLRTHWAKHGTNKFVTIR